VTVKGHDDKLEISVVIPAFNEANRIGHAKQELEFAILQGVIEPEAAQLILVDDGSTDDTSNLLQSELGGLFKETVVLRSPFNQGKGAAVRRGVAAATAPLTVFMDMDMAVSPMSIPHLVQALSQSDIAIGSRSHPKSILQQNRRSRVIMGKAYSLLAKRFTEIEFRDTQCGFKAFKTDRARILFHFLPVNRFGFDLEVLLLAKSFGFTIEEVPIEWIDMPGSKVRILRDSVSVMADFFRNRLSPKRLPIYGIQVDSKTLETLERETSIWNPDSLPTFSFVGANANHCLVFPLSSSGAVAAVSSAAGVFVGADLIVSVRFSASELAGHMSHAQ